eukprot:augustus_masked-scaffold_8-processed-gene-7.9-mRNA-1 protein AED:1.00 eAED:1.00 QI:0/-1/0/0/-1/1/1/0/373
MGSPKSEKREKSSKRHNNPKSSKHGKSHKKKKRSKDSNSFVSRSGYAESSGRGSKSTMATKSSRSGKGEAGFMAQSTYRSGFPGSTSGFRQGNSLNSLESLPVAVDLESNAPPRKYMKNSASRNARGAGATGTNSREQVSINQLAVNYFTSLKTTASKFKETGARVSAVQAYSAAKSKLQRKPEHVSFGTSINKSKEDSSDEPWKKKCLCCTCTKNKLRCWGVILFIIAVIIFFIFPRVPEFDVDAGGVEFGDVSLQYVELSLPVILDSENFVDIGLTDVRAVVELQGGFEILADLQEPINIESQGVSIAIIDVVIDFTQDDVGNSAAAFAFSCLTNQPFEITLFNNIDVVYLGIPISIDDDEGTTIEIDCPI